MKKKILLLLPITLICAASLTACGNSDAVATHTHSYSNEWSKDQSKHWHASTCGDDSKADEEEHSYDEWIAIRGEKVRFCLVCGYEETKEFDLNVSYKVTWLNYDGSILEIDTVPEGSLPEYNGDTPTKELNEGYEYSFDGWDKQIGVVISDVTYKATYYETLTFEYTTNEDNTLTITNYNGTKNEVVVPSTIDGKTVSSIGKSAFSYCSNLTSITIPDSVTNIGKSAFFYCSNLTSVTIGNSVTSIENEAFSECYRLVEVINKSSLNITAGSEDNGFVGYYALNIKNNGESEIVNKDDYLFYTVNNTNYLLGYIGNDIVLVLPNDYNGESYVINKYAFFNPFSNWRSLTSITIPNSVTSIGEAAFLNCSNLTSVTIGNSVTSIANAAFSGCYRLVEVINKSSLNITAGSEDNGYVGYYALNIKNNGESEIVNKDDYLFYTVNNINYLLDYIGKETSLNLPNNYNGKSYKIHDHAFYFCDNLTSITIPDSVTSIGESALESCWSLTSITILDSVTNIGSYAFFDCLALTSVTIPNSVTSIGYSAFSYCSRLQYNEYDNGYYLGNETNPYLVLVKAKSKDISSCIINDNCKIIYHYAFSECSSLTSVTIGNSVTSIGNSAFSNCSSLQYNEYDNGYYLGNEDNPYLVLVAAKSTSITSCIISGRCKFIYCLAFSECSSLTSVTIPDSVTSIGVFAFNGCSSLTSITIPNSVTNIGRNAFNLYSSLNTVYFKGTIEEWNNINFDSTNTRLMNCTKYFYSESEPTDTTNNYWHYVVGDPTAW